jgi:hypothetical protein
MPIGTGGAQPQGGSGGGGGTPSFSPPINSPNVGTRYKAHMPHQRVRSQPDSLGSRTDLQLCALHRASNRPCERRFLGWLRGGVGDEIG